MNFMDSGECLFGITTLLEKLPPYLQELSPNWLELQPYCGITTLFPWIHRIIITMTT